VAAHGAAADQAFAERAEPAYFGGAAAVAAAPAPAPGAPAPDPATSDPTTAERL